MANNSDESSCVASLLLVHEIMRLSTMTIFAAFFILRLFFSVASRYCLQKNLNNTLSPLKCTFLSIENLYMQLNYISPSSFGSLNSSKGANSQITKGIEAQGFVIILTNFDGILATFRSSCFLHRLHV